MQLYQTNVFAEIFNFGFGNRYCMKLGKCPLKSTLTRRQKTFLNDRNGLQVKRTDSERS